MIELETPRVYAPQHASLLRSRPRPKLLVSVRDAAEAKSAVESDILDIKEPLRGAMGYAGLETVQNIANEWYGDPPFLSVALGEVLDWKHREADRIPERVCMGKIGLAGLGHESRWREQLIELRQRFDALRLNPIHWITVAYADSQAAHSPPLQEVFEWALETGSMGFLIDTWGKSSGNVFNFLGMNLLHSMMAQGFLWQVPCALAGRILPADIGRAVEVHPAVIAVRSAACRQGDRRQSIDGEAVRALRAAIWSAELHTWPIASDPVAYSNLHQW
ncbi:MAG: hypothetical protein IT428_18365 [Planctomycetaceae bacterium]|nr:hypothetical protein [Planctomycetaceae bacterium]